MKPNYTARISAALFPAAILLLSGCAQRTVVAAPPMNNAQLAPAVQVQGQSGSAAQVYAWQDVPQGQEVPITRATFDQGGYQIFAASGETIVVPFVNQNLYAMKFGRSTRGESYFVNQGDAPTLYLANGGFLENAAAQNARWYPIPESYGYTRPIYVTVAPSYSEFAAMGWYPGMNYYGGMWGYYPHSSFVWMPGFYIGIGGSRYTTYTSYHSYYIHTPGYVRTTVVHTYYPARGTNRFTSRTTFRSGTNRSFNSGTRRTFNSTSRPFGGNSSSNSGSFSTRRTTPSGGTFGTRPSGGSFGTRPAGGTSGTRPSGGSFGTRPSGGAFSGGRSSGGSFGGGRSSGGGGSFGRRR